MCDKLTTKHPDIVCVVKRWVAGLVRVQLLKLRHKDVYWDLQVGKRGKKHPSQHTHQDMIHLMSLCTEHLYSTRLHLIICHRLDHPLRAIILTEHSQRYFTKLIYF